MAVVVVRGRELWDAFCVLVGALSKGCPECMAEVLQRYCSCLRDVADWEQQAQERLDVVPHQDAQRGNNVMEGNEQVGTFAA